jgi:hypothetical protein
MRGGRLKIRDESCPPELLDEPGHFTRPVHQRPATARRLHIARLLLRAERGVPNTEPDYNPAYFVDELDHH